MTNPTRPYSLWRRAGDLIVFSGQTGVVPSDNGPVIIDGGTTMELRQVLANSRDLLAECGVSFDQVIKATLFLTSLDELVECNKIWIESFNDPRPARTTVAVAALPRGAKVEVEMWAYAPIQ